MIEFWWRNRPTNRSSCWQNHVMPNRCISTDDRVEWSLVNSRCHTPTRRGQVKHDKATGKAAIDCTDDIVMNTKHSYLCRMVVSGDGIGRLSRREKLVSVNMCNKTVIYNPLDLRPQLDAKVRLDMGR
jgi:hypothetical protein